MKLSKPKYISGLKSYTKTGRKNGYKVSINYNDYYKKYYFCLEKGEYRFNSLHEELKYITEGNCVEGAEKYVETLTKMGGK